MFLISNARYCSLMSSLKLRRIADGTKLFKQRCLINRLIVEIVRVTPYVMNTDTSATHARSVTDKLKTVRDLLVYTNAAFSFNFDT